MYEEDDGMPKVQEVGDGGVAEVSEELSSEISINSVVGHTNLKP